MNGARNRRQIDRRDREAGNAPTDPEKLGRLYEDLVERDASQPDLTDTQGQDIIGTQNGGLLDLDTAPEVYFEEITPPGSDHPVTVYTDGYAQINKGKIDIYMRGKVKLENEPALRARSAELKSIKKHQPSQFTPVLLDEQKYIEKQLHNYDRSREMNVSLEKSGVPDTEDGNVFLANEILQSAREATSAKPIVNRLIQAPNCELRIESRWVIDKSGKPYLETVILSPHNKERYKSDEQF